MKTTRNSAHLLGADKPRLVDATRYPWTTHVVPIAVSVKLLEPVGLGRSAFAADDPPGERVDHERHVHEHPLASAT